MNTTIQPLSLPETIEALRPWVEALFDQRVVWARSRNPLGAYSPWFPCVVTEILRPSPYNIEWGTVCLQPTNPLPFQANVTYIYPPNSDCLSMEQPS